MALIPYADLQAMPKEARDSIQFFESMHGRPTLVRRMIAHFAPLSEAIHTMYPAFMTEGKLGQKIKELMFVAASHVHGCTY